MLAAKTATRRAAGWTSIGVTHVMIQGSPSGPRTATTASSTAFFAATHSSCVAWRWTFAMTRTPRSSLSRVASGPASAVTTLVQRAASVASAALP